MEYTSSKSFSLSKFIDSFMGIAIALFYFWILFFAHQEVAVIIGFFLLQLMYVIFFQQKVVFDISMRLWLTFIAVALFGVVISGQLTVPIILFLLNLLIGYFNYSIISKNRTIFNVSIKGLYVVSFFFLMGSLLQFINPELLTSINQFHLSDRLFLESASYVYRGYASGFFNQIGTNGYVMSVMLAFVFVNFFKTQNWFRKIINLILFILLIYIIFMTGKRGFILFNAIIIVFLVPFVTKYKYLAPIIIGLFAILFGWVLLNSEAGQQFIIRMQASDISSGRFMLNDIMVNDFSQRPLFGNGTYTTRAAILKDTFLEMDGHNIYLQVLRENGLLGFIPLVLFVGFNLFNSIKKLFDFTKNESKSKYVVILAVYIQLLFIFWGFTGNPLYDSYPLFLYCISLAYVKFTELNYSTIND
ncbi:O-antigen ligase family protein [Aerococcus urinaeequi]